MSMRTGQDGFGQNSNPARGHAHSKSHSGLNTYTTPSHAHPHPMDRSASGGGLSPNNSPSPNNLATNGTSSGNSRYRSSVDAARSLYAGSSSLQPGNASPNLGSASAGLANRHSTSSKRPSSELLQSGLGAGLNAENDAIDKWFEDLQHYEATLEEMAAASLDQSFKEELGAIEQWFRVLSEPERTAALYSLLQSSSQVQIRFFITVLQQMARQDPMNALLSPANPGQASMEAQMEAKLASLGVKSPASPVMRQFARQSLGATPGGSVDPAGFLSPNSAMLNPNNNGPSTPSHDQQQRDASADAANLLAQQRAKLNAAQNRISAPGSLLASYDREPMRSPLWSQAANDQVAERRSPSPDSRAGGAGSAPRSRPSSGIFDNGNSNSAGNLANNLSPNVSRSSAQDSSTSQIPPYPDLPQLSPALAGQSWAAMMQTPLLSSFAGNGNAADTSGTFPNLAAAMAANSNETSAQAASRLVNPFASNQDTNSNIVLDDARKFRRSNRASDAGLNNEPLPGQPQGYQPPQNRNGQNNNGSAFNNMPLSASGGANSLSQSQAAALSAQQNWRNVNGIGAGGQAGSSDLSNLAAAMGAMNMNGVQSPQLAMANLLAAQQQIQQQMQLQQMLSAGLGPMSGMMGMGNTSGAGMNGNQMQNQQMMSPLLGGGMGMGMGMMGSPLMNATSRGRSPRPSGANSTPSKGGAAGGAAGINNVVPGSGTNPDEPLDMKLLEDIPSWLRSLRLHKYTPNFERSNWKEMVSMTDADLDNKGVAALGARRKLLKVFENVRNMKGIPHPAGSEVPSAAGSTRADSPGAGSNA